jgi:hypothetical protein
MAHVCREATCTEPSTTSAMLAMVSGTPQPSDPSKMMVSCRVSPRASSNGPVVAVRQASRLVTCRTRVCTRPVRRPARAAQTAWSAGYGTH